jgi:hypothetical protein
MEVLGSKLLDNLNVFLKILIERVEFSLKNFNKVENNLIYAKATQVLQY